jgi:carboxylesterase type B
MVMFYSFLLAFCALVASVAAASGPALLVQTTSGLVRGFNDTNTTSVQLQKWYGIRYAADTSGRNRFRPPQPVIPPPGIVDGTKFGPACLQGQSVLMNAGDKK